MPTVSADPTAARTTGWTSDLEGLLPGMEAVHPDLYHGTPKADMEAAIADLEATIPTATDDELMVGVARIAAMVSAAGRDGHTGLFMWGAGDYPVTSLPLRLWSFSDGLYVVDALPPYEALVGRRVEAMGGHPIADVVAAIDPIVPRDNEATVRLLTPRYLLIPEVLHGLGLLDAVGPVKVDLVDATGTPTTVDVEPITMADYNAWAGPYGLFLPPRGDAPRPSIGDERLRSQVLEDADALLVNYDRFEGLPHDALQAVGEGLARPDVQRVVVDVRQNYGGQIGLDQPLLDILLPYGQANPGRLFVLTGRNTFSAASLFVAALVRDAGARIVGEPMAGATAFWGDTSTVRLPYSKLALLVADASYRDPETTTEALTLEPDIAAPMSSKDYFINGRDPALEAALGAP